MIQLTNTNTGHAVLINRDLIAAIEPGDGVTMVFLDDGQAYSVSETVEEIQRMLK